MRFSNYHIREDPEDVLNNNPHLLKLISADFMVKVGVEHLVFMLICHEQCLESIETVFFPADTVLLAVEIETILLNPTSI